MGLFRGRYMFLWELLAFQIGVNLQLSDVSQVALAGGAFLAAEGGVGSLYQFFYYLKG